MIGAYDQVGLPKWEATYSAGQDQIIGFHDYVAGKDLIPIRDWRNNVVSAFDVATQTALGHAEYSPEGRVTSFVTGSPTCVEEGIGAICGLPGGLPFAFNGQWWSDKTGLTYMRNRWYSARLGQFVSTDPLHYVDSVNQYAFVGFDPINAWDPWGLGADDLSWNTSFPAQRDYWIAKQEQDLRKAEERAQQRRSAPKINDIGQVGIGALRSAAVGAGAVACARRHPGCGLLLIGLLDMENENSIPNILVPANKDQAIGMLTMDLWIGVFALTKTAPAEAVTVLTKDKSRIGALSEPGKYRPNRDLPLDIHGNKLPDTEFPHTQIATKRGRNGDYTQAREWEYNSDGVLAPKRDIDFTDHGRPNGHANPHQHDWEPNQRTTWRRKTNGMAMIKTIKFPAFRSEGVDVRLDEVLEKIPDNDFVWVLMDYDGMGQAPDNLTMDEFQQQILGNNGLIMEWRGLKEFASNQIQTIDCFLLAAESEERLHEARKLGDFELCDFSLCEVMIIAFDSTEWEVWAKDNTTMKNLVEVY